MATTSFWLLLDRMFRMGIGFAISILIARYYGPAEWGALSYVLVSATLFGALASAGGEDLILKDLSQAQSTEELATIQKTAFGLRIFFSVLAYMALMTLIYATQGMGLPFMLALIYGLVFVFNTSEIWEYRLRVEQRITSIARSHIVSSVISGIFRVGAVLIGCPIAVVTAGMSGEYLANNLILNFYKRRYWQSGGQFSVAYAKKLLRRSLFVMFSGVLMVCQTRFEFYLIEHFMDMRALGQYAAAMKIMELFEIAILVFSMTLMPELAKKLDTEFPRLAKRTYLLGFCIYALMLIPMAIIYLLFPWFYGAQYIEAQSLLPILAARPLLIIFGSIRSIFLVLEGGLHYAPFCAALGLLCSLGLGWYLVPHLGLIGAAISGLTSLLVSNFLVDFFFKQENVRRIFGSFEQIGYLKELALSIYNRRFGKVNH